MTRVVKDSRGHVHVYLGDAPPKTAGEIADELNALRKEKGLEPKNYRGWPRDALQLRLNDAKRGVFKDADVGVPIGAIVKINAPGIRGHGETGKVLSKRDGHLQIQSGPNEHTNYMIPEGKVTVVAGPKAVTTAPKSREERVIETGRQFGQSISKNESKRIASLLRGRGSDTSSGPFSGSRALRRSGKVSLIEGDGDDRGYFGVRVEGKGTKPFNRRSDADAYFDECVKKYGKTEDAYRVVRKSGSFIVMENDGKYFVATSRYPSARLPNGQMAEEHPSLNSAAEAMYELHSEFDDRATVDPLASGSSRAAVSENVKTEMAAGRPQAQAVAIALRKAGLSNKDAAAYARARARAKDAELVLARDLKQPDAERRVSAIKREEAKLRQLGGTGNYSDVKMVPRPAMSGHGLTDATRYDVVVTTKDASPFRDMTPRDWAGVEKFIAEEKGELEHANDASGRRNSAIIRQEINAAKKELAEFEKDPGSSKDRKRVDELLDQIDELEGELALSLR